MAESSEDARKHIEELGYNASQEAFIEYILNFKKMFPDYIKAGISPDTREDNPPYRTVLMIAIAQNDSGLANIFLEAGADFRCKW